MRVGLVGSVSSSLLTLRKLVEYYFDIVGVWGYEPVSTHNVSDYCSLREFSEEQGLPFHPFVKINDARTKQEIKDVNPELLFVVGLSQLIDNDIIELPKYGCVGFHPTKLPKGRGRAPLAWLILKENEGAATFFKIEGGADCGDIFVQETYIVGDNDDATSIAEKIRACILKALDKWLPVLKEVGPVGVKQDEAQATYYARRAPLDGFIDWFRPAKEIHKLIRATSRPFPGAYTFYDDYKVVIWKSCYYHTGFPLGVIGRVVESKDGHPVVQTGNGYIELLEYEIQDIHETKTDKNVVVGSRLGYYEQFEIFKLRNDIKDIKRAIENRYEKSTSDCPTSR